MLEAHKTMTHRMWGVVVMKLSQAMFRVIRSLLYPPVRLLLERRLLLPLLVVLQCRPHHCLHQRLPHKQQLQIHHLL